MTELVYSTPLKEAIRAFWYANSQLHKAQHEKQVPRVIAFYREQVSVQESLVLHNQQHTTTVVITGDDSSSYDSQIDLEGIEVLVQRGIVHECLACEEQEDLASCYGGDHREFHLSGEHHERCIDRALHQHDPVRWPLLAIPNENDYSCVQCESEAVRPIEN